MKKVFLSLAVLLLLVPAAWAQGGGHISGTVYADTPDGNVPLGNAHIGIFLADGHMPVAGGMTDSLGSYSVNVRHGNYQVRADKWSFIGEWYDDVQRRSDATVVTVTDSSNAEGVDFVLASFESNGGSISGTITDAGTGNPIPGAMVTARGSSNWNMGHAYSDTAGNYVMTGLRADTYTVAAGKEGYARTEYPDSVVLNGDDVTGIDIALTPYVQTGISGTVTDLASGLPIAGAHVVAYDVDHRFFCRMGYTGEDGTYSIQLRPGEYRVQAYARGYVEMEYPQHVIVTADGFTENIDFALETLHFGSISGAVSDTAGDPIGQAYVVARKLGNRFAQHTRTDSSGAYTLSNLLPGYYNVRAYHRDYAPNVYPDSVGVANDQDVIGIDIVLAPYQTDFDGFISGTVTDDSTGDPIANARVMLMGRDGGPYHRHWFVRRTFTDSTGAYIFQELPDVELRVFADAEGYMGEFYDNVNRYWEATPVTPDAENINFALTQGGWGIRSIYGQIQLPDGAMVDGAIAYATLDGQIVGVTSADESGFYDFANLEPGAYEISAFSLYGEGEFGNPISLEFEDYGNADIEIITTSVDDGNAQLPTSAMLDQNYPNPFNAGTLISFALPSGQNVELTIYNLTGQKVISLADGFYQAGKHELTWNGNDSFGKPAASGIYYYNLKTDDNSETRRMTLLK